MSRSAAEMGKIIAAALTLILVLSVAVGAEAVSLKDPETKGIAINLGSSYDPSPTFGFAQLSLMALYDYEQIWGHSAPEALRFKLEGSIGVADRSGPRALMSANFLALYYLDRLRTARMRPYVEAGVGIVYSDFQVEGQGLRINFNPQVGIGAFWGSDMDNSWYSSVRAYHISNGQLHSDNRGINAVMMQLGLCF